MLIEGRKIKKGGKTDEKKISKRISVHEASKFKSFFTKVTVPLIRRKLAQKPNTAKPVIE